MNHQDLTLTDIRDLSGAFECYEVVRTYEICRRRAGTQEVRTVRIEVLQGEDGGYLVQAADDVGRTATGNPNADPYDALLGIRWHDLDRDEVLPT